jgi:cytochrome c-type biogenesis protein
VQIAGRTFVTTTVNIAVAVAFASMGGLVLYLAAAGNPMGAGGPQLTVGRWLTSVLARVLSFLKPVPEPILGLALLGLAALFVTIALRGRPAAERPPDPGGSCHEPQLMAEHGDLQLPVIQAGPNEQSEQAA